MLLVPLPTPATYCADMRLFGCGQKNSLGRGGAHGPGEDGAKPCCSKRGLLHLWSAFSGVCAPARVDLHPRQRNGVAGDGQLLVGGDDQHGDL